jgi:hypothetical protein
VRRALALAVVALAVARPAPVAAHAPPSEATVDRYLKVTPMGDRIRLAYTIVFGQEPGRRVRPRLDRDRDRTVTDAEARPLGEDLARQVATALSLAVDDRTTPVTCRGAVAGRRAAHRGRHHLDRPRRPAGDRPRPDLPGRLRRGPAARRPLPRGRWRRARGARLAVPRRHRRWGGDRDRRALAPG